MIKKLLLSLMAGLKDEAGLTMVEYAVAGSLITGAVSAAFILLGGAVTGEIGILTGLVGA
jgi:pilus assembly protein Flp/PilA